jgi:signal transduction histidine kinase
VPDGLPKIMADTVRLTQALMNLVINAMQAVEKRGLIEVSVAVADESVAIEVRDTGPGIPSEKLKSIFEPYFTTKAEGHGLGLWIAQQIATAHGGTLRALNAEAGGAIFSISLPLVRAAQIGDARQEK